MSTGYFLHVGRRSLGGVVIPAPPPPTGFGSRIGDWMAQPGDQVLVVPDGSTLTGEIPNLLACSHPATAGPYGGWLIIMCETMGGSTLDLSDPMVGSYRGGMDLRYDGVAHGFTRLPMRVALLGFKQRGGTIRPEWVNRLRFGWWDASWSDTVWQAYYDQLYFAAHGSHPSPSPSTTFDATVFGPSINWHPTTFGIDQCLRDSGPSGRGGIEFFFFDAHNIGDDAVYATSSDVAIYGGRGDDIYHHGTNYFNPATGADLIHSDWIQAAGCNLYLRHVGGGGHIDWEGTAAGSVSVDADDGWLYGSSIPAAGFGTDGIHHVVGTITNFKWFAAGQYYNPAVNPATLSTPHYDASSDRLLDDYDPPGLTWDGQSGSAWAAAHKILPSGVTTAGGLITPDLVVPLPGSYPSVPSVFDHASNPGKVALLANPYSSALTFLTAWGWT